MPNNVSGAAVSLRSGIEPGPRMNVMDFRKLDAGADGSIWASDGNRVAMWSSTTSALVQLGRVNVPSGVQQAIAAVNGSLAYVLDTIDGKASIVSFGRTGAGPALAALPDGAAPVAVTAAADGTLWALDKTRKLLFSKSGTAWTRVALPAGVTCELVSVGNANLAVMVGSRATNAGVFTFNGTSWSEVLVLPNMPLWVAACPDGAYWLTGGASLVLTLPGGTTKTYDLPPDAAPLWRFAAASRYACYFGSQMQLFVALYGLLDEPDDGWPAFAGKEAAAYDAINTQLHVADPGGVRGQYPNLNAPLSSYYTDVRSMTCPAGVGEADWLRVRDTIAGELKNAESVRNLFNNLKLLNNAVSTRLSEARARVTAMVGLPEETHAQPQSRIDLALGKLLDKAFGAAVAKVPGAMGKAANVAVSLAKNAADAQIKALGAPDAGTTVQIACADLSKTLAELQAKTMTETAQTINKLLKNERKLAAAGDAVASGLWYWHPEFDANVIADIGPGAELQMYQMLMPVRWSILRFMTLFSASGIPGPRPFPTHAPAVALMFKNVLDDRANMLSWWWICAAEGAPPRRDTTGPFPNKALLETIMKLTTPLQFFTGEGGWKLPVRTADGWIEPPDGVQWQPWVPVDAPLQ